MTKKNSSYTIGNISIMATGLALSLGLAACQNAPKNENLPELKLIAAKLDAISQKIDAMSGRARAPAQVQPKRPTVGQLYKVSVDPEDAYRGGEDAKVTVVLASEFACPYCAQLATETDKLLEHFSDEDLKVVSKHFVVHPTVATDAAHAVCAADQQGKFAEYENLLWQKAWHADDTTRLDRQVLSLEGLQGLAKSVGLDLARFKTDMEGECPKMVAKNHREMASLGVNGTPAVYINGAYYGGARSFEALKAAIDGELARVDAALAKGESRDGYYDRLIAKGKTSI